jgi:hypothetical protein
MSREMYEQKCEKLLLVSDHCARVEAPKNKHDGGILERNASEFC